MIQNWGDPEDAAKYAHQPRKARVSSNLTLPLRAHLTFVPASQERAVLMGRKSSTVNLNRDKGRLLKNGLPCLEPRLE